MFNNFFPIVDTCLSCEHTARQSCAMVPNGNFLRPAFTSEPRAAHSDVHSKFALKPHHVWSGSMVDIQSPTAEIRRGKKKKEDRNHRAKI